MSVESQLEFQYQLASFLKDSILRFCKDWEAGERGEFRPPGPAHRYVVRADTDLGPVYLRSLTGSCTEWTSELRYAHRYLDRFSAQIDAGRCFCPDASRIRVRPLRRVSVTGYHVAWSWGDVNTGYAVTDDPKTDYLRKYGPYSKRHIFPSRKAAQKFIDGCTISKKSDLQIVPETRPVSPERPETAGGGAH